jgi:hypothetical protein
MISSNFDCDDKSQFNLIYKPIEKFIEFQEKPITVDCGMFPVFRLGANYLLLLIPVDCRRKTWISRVHCEVPKRTNLNFSFEGLKFLSP